MLPIGSDCRRLFTRERSILPLLKNTRHERFAQELAQGKTATEAYVLAGYKANDGNAATLKANEEVAARVAELQDRASIRAEITVASLLAETETARELAMALGQPSAAVAAIKEKGVLSGLRVEKSERTNRSDVRSLTNAELDAAIADALAREKEAAEGKKLAH